MNGNKGHDGAGKAPCLKRDFDRIVDAMPETLPNYHAEKLAYSLGEVTGVRGVSLENMTNDEAVLSIVNSNDRKSTVTGKPILLVTGVFRVIKNNPNGNLPFTLEGDPDGGKRDIVACLQRFLRHKLGEKYDLRKADEWKNDAEWLKVKDDKLFHWNTANGLSQCFAKRAEKAGFPPGHFTFHSLRE